MRDEPTEDFHDEMREKELELRGERDAPRGMFWWFSSMKPRAQMILLAMVCLEIYFWIYKTVSRKTLGMMMVGTVAVAIYLANNTMSGDEGILDEEESARLLDQKLRRMQVPGRVGEGRRIPLGKVVVDSIGKLVYMEGDPWKRLHTFKVIGDDGIEHKYSAAMGPYTGKLLEIIKRDRGYSGDDLEQDVKFIPSRDLMQDKRRMQYEGKYARRGGGGGGGYGPG